MHPLAARLEPARLEDIAGVTALVRAVDISETGESETSEDEIRHEWEAESMDLAGDARVVRGEDGSIIANAELTPRVAGEEYDAHLDVHPSHADEPWFDVLISWLLEQAASRSGPAGARLGIYSIEGNAPKRAALEAAGFACDRVILRMTITLPDSPPARPTMPTGFSLAEFRPGLDDVELHAVLEESFADHYRPHPRTLETWRAEVLGDPQFRANLFMIAREGDLACGAIEAFDKGEVGWVSRLGTRAAARGRGVARALLLDSFARFHAIGKRRVELGVDAQNASGATALYESVGMTRTLQHGLWRRAVGGA